MSDHLRRRAERSTPFGVAVGVALVVLAGCEAIFTFSPVGFLQTPPANMSAEQLAGFGADALSSGDPVAMAAALDAINALIAAGGLSDAQIADLSLAGGGLAIDLSGIGDVLQGVLQGDVALNDFAIFDAALADLGVDLALLSSGGDLLLGADAGGAELNSSLLALAAIGLIVDPVSGDFEGGACGAIPPAELAFHEALWASIGEDTNPDGSPVSCPP